MEMPFSESIRIKNLTRSFKQNILRSNPASNSEPPIFFEMFFMILRGGYGDMPNPGCLFS